MQIFTYPSQAAQHRVERIARRSIDFGKKEIRAVERILKDVRQRGDQALIDYTQRFDAPSLTVEKLKVGQEELKEAAARVDRTFRGTLKRAISQIESFHRQQLPRSWFDARRAGTFLGQMVHPVDSAGIYVPGGKSGSTPLVSSVLMGAIPAKIAGVSRICLVTPPTADGSINPHLLAAAHQVGVDAVYKLGSAWAIAALAYGTESVPRADVIVGPGNIYVTLAKKLVAGTVGIDMLAGPSEILVLADHSARADFVAADLLSQAEHDPLASAVMVTDSKALARAVQTALAEQLESLDRREIARQAIDHFGAILVVADMHRAVDLANRFAPEHLELCVENPFAIVGQIRNAGAVFMGHYTPEPIGDYLAGPNHVLPTAGTARFSSALSVEHFIKKTSLIHYSPDALQREGQDVTRLAHIEGLDAHARAVQVRLSHLARQAAPSLTTCYRPLRPPVNYR
jgi:histidinol dehydrogenase